MRNGPRAGLFVFATIIDRPDWPQGYGQSAFQQLSDVLSIRDEHVTTGHGLLRNRRALCDVPPTETVVRHILRTITQACEQRPEALEYFRIAGHLPAIGTMSSADGLRAIVGQTYNGQPHPVILDDESVHGLIGGRTRSGKTVFLHDMICGLANSYRPEQLQL